MDAPPPTWIPRGNAPQRVIDHGRVTIDRVAFPRAPLGDTFHFLMTTSWGSFLGFLVGAYLALNCLFAPLYVATGAEIHNAQPGSFTDAYFFSIQTMSTIGFGYLAPDDLSANALVALESVVGLLGTAMATGLIFAKFSRPTARIAFSRVAVLGTRDGRPALMFRVANERGNNIVGARMRLVLTRIEQTSEHELVRRFVPLALERPENELFSLVWQGTHYVDGDSPLRDQTPESLDGTGTQLLVQVTGTDQDLAQTIHASYTYLPCDLVPGARLADMLSLGEGGRRKADFRKFHDTVPLEPAGPLALGNGRGT